MDWFRKLMRGRNGVDHLSVLFLLLYWPFTIAARLTGNQWLGIPALLCMYAACFRILSKNIPRRRAENQKLLYLWQRMTGRAAPRANPKADASHRYFNCPGCNQKLRVPAGKGNITILCPKCKKTFHEKT